MLLDWRGWYKIQLVIIYTLVLLPLLTEETMMQIEVWRCDDDGPRGCCFVFTSSKLCFQFNFNPRPSFHSTVFPSTGHVQTWNWFLKSDIPSPVMFLLFAVHYKTHPIIKEFKLLHKMKPCTWYSQNYLKLNECNVYFLCKICSFLMLYFQFHYDFSYLLFTIYLISFQTEKEAAAATTTTKSNRGNNPERPIGYDEPGRRSELSRSLSETRRPRKDCHRHGDAGPGDLQGVVPAHVAAGWKPGD